MRSLSGAPAIRPPSVGPSGGGTENRFCGGEVGRGDARPVSDVLETGIGMLVAVHPGAVNAGPGIVDVPNIRNQISR